MKTIVLLFVLTMLCSAQSFSIHIPLSPSWWKSTSGAEKFMFFSSAALESANALDAVTTYKGVIVGTAACETSPLYSTGPCSTHNISDVRFGVGKSLIAAVPFAEYVPKWVHKRSAGYNLFFGIINTAAAIPLTVGVVNNYRILNSSSK